MKTMKNEAAALATGLAIFALAGIAHATCGIYTASYSYPAYSTTWTPAQCDAYSASGLGHCYEYGGDAGWGGAQEGVDCSSYVPRCWAIPGYISQTTTGPHPYSTTSFYPNNGGACGVPHANRVTVNSISDIHPWDCFVLNSHFGNLNDDHMGLVVSVDIANNIIHTREANCTGCGINPCQWSYSTLITGGQARIFRRDAWGATTPARVGVARTADGGGYWIAATDGGVFSFGDAMFYGSMGGKTLNAPVVGICARPQGDGYWLVASDGGIFNFGNAPFQGSMGGQHLNKPICGIACTQSGNGYWLVGQDGGIFNFGDAAFYGSLGSAGYTDITGITPAWHSDKSNGYRIFRSNGCTYDYNCAHLGGGDAGSQVYASATTGADNGFWEVMSGGGAVYTYGNAAYHGGNNPSSNIFIGMARGPSLTGGYWLCDNTGAIFSFGDAAFHGGANFH